MIHARFNNRLEIGFDHKPDTRTREGLKLHGFRWDSRALVWHLADPVSITWKNGAMQLQDGIAFALDFLAARQWITPAQGAELRRLMDSHAESAALRSMMIANGIE